MFDDALYSAFTENSRSSRERKGHEPVRSQDELHQSLADFTGIRTYVLYSQAEGQQERSTRISTIHSVNCDCILKIQIIYIFWLHNILL